METEKSVFEILSAINVNEHTEKKNNLTYLSWAWAWGITKKTFPDANYEVQLWDGKPYLFDADLGYLIKTIVTIKGESIPMHLFVMDGANKAQKNVAYEYKTKYDTKTVTAASMFDINTTIMRCLTKNLAMFGLGHYIYAGEDLPEQLKDEPKEQPKVEPKKEVKQEQPKDVVVPQSFYKAVDECKTSEQLKKYFESTGEFQLNTDFRAYVINKGMEIKTNTNT